MTDIKQENLDMRVVRRALAIYAQICRGKTYARAEGEELTQALHDEAIAEADKAQALCDQLGVVMLGRIIDEYVYQQHQKIRQFVIANGLHKDSDPDKTAAEIVLELARQAFDAKKN